MNINHRAEAEKHLATAARHLTEVPADMRIAEVAAWIGQGYAALARDEDQAATTADLRDATRALRRREYAMREAVSTHIAQALASRDANRWKAGRDLAQALDEADCNVDDLIDARLVDDGWDARSAWKTPASLLPAGGWIAYAATRDGAAPERGPWAPAPDVTDQIPEVVRRLFADHIARMLLNGDSEVVQAWARNFAFALKNEGADFTGDIEKRITDLTLGRDPAEPPF